MKFGRPSDTSDVLVQSVKAITITVHSLSFLRSSLVFACLFSAGLSAPCRAAILITHASQQFDHVGYVDAVDPVHKQISFSFDGAVYVVHTDVSKIHLLSQLVAAPETGDLVIGMRAEVLGTIVQSGNIEASSIQVLPYLPPVPVDPPVGSVFPAPQQNESVRGTIISEASLFSRKIKIRTSVGDLNVNVPRGITIQFGGQPISVHDLSNGTDVMIFGQLDINNTLTASKIVVGANNGR